jgi:hypothetical protein
MNNLATADLPTIGRLDPAISQTNGSRRSRIGQADTRSPRYFDLPFADSPWRVGDVVRLMGWLTFGLIGVGVAWIFVSGTTAWRTQAIWSAVGAGAVAIAMVGAAFWLVSGFGSVGRERSQLRLRVTTLTEMLQPTGRAEEASDALLWTPTTRHFHRSTCQLTIGKAARAGARPDFLAQGIEPCGMCRP